MAKLTWSAKASVNPEEIYEYVSKGSKHYVKFLAQRVTAVVESIAELPMVGRIVPEY